MKKREAASLFLSFSFRLHGFGKRPGELVRTAGGLAAALDALQLADGLLGRHVLDQTANPLQVPVAAAGEDHGPDHAVLQLQIDPGGADAGGRISIGHSVVSPFQIFP